MKKTLATLAIIATLALTGCGTSEKNVSGTEKVTTSTVTLPGGRTVTCVKYNSNNHVGGITCDWEGAK